MGQKIHPVGLRLGITRTWDSRWYEKKQYTAWLHEDVAIRKYLGRLTRAAAISRVEIERRANQARVIVHTAKPGIIIGKRGVGIEDIRRNLEQLTQKNVQVNVVEIKHPELDGAPGRAEHRRPAREAHRVPPRHEAGDHAHDEGRRARRQGPGLGPPRRLRNRALRAESRRQGSAAHAARRHRLRARRSVHDVRPHRHEGLDLQGRGSARRSRAAEARVRAPQRRASARSSATGADDARRTWPRRPASGGERRRDPVA